MMTTETAAVLVKKFKEFTEHKLCDCIEVRHADDFDEIMYMDSVSAIQYKYVGPEKRLILVNIPRASFSVEKLMEAIDSNESQFTMYFNGLWSEDSDEFKRICAGVDSLINEPSLQLKRGSISSTRFMSCSRRRAEDSCKLQLKEPRFQRGFLFCLFQYIIRHILRLWLFTEEDVDATIRFNTSTHGSWRQASV